ncbi:MAG: S41 family peptidase [Chitinophagales bacterium]|nr:S41 family peptidase [Chitinophagales bacterium]
MLKKFKSWLYKSKGFVAGVALAGVFFIFIQARNTDSYFEISKNLDIFNTVLKELNIYYVDPIEPGQLVKTGIDEMLATLDPYTNYITESDFEEYQFQTTGKYGGIGANMRTTQDSIYVGDVYEGSPADKAGLHPGDLVISVAGKEVKGKDTEEMSVLLKGSPGTQVTVKVRDVYTGQVSEKVITRSEIELSSVPYASLLGTKKDIAYVKLTQFTPHCGRLVKNHLDSLKKLNPSLNGVVLDLRNNPGGLLNEAVNVCNLFVDKGQLVVSTKGRQKEWEQDFKTSQQAWDTKIPVTILINHGSASASEIVAGTLQDLDRGVIVGERSFGKGLVQTTRPLGYNARLKLTTAKYYTPSGRCIQALDYSHRNVDGSVGYVPDSLKKEYKTLKGRKVLSGGGVEPDVDVEDDVASKLAITLYVKNYFFDYATIYARKNKTIPQPSTFAIDNNTFNDFAKWLEGKDYTYKTETEITLDSLKSAAVREKYFNDIESSYKALEAKLRHDKKQDLEKHRDIITDLLESEIVSRFYYMRGRVEHGLKNDVSLKKALALLEQPTGYNSILQP